MVLTQPGTLPRLRDLTVPGSAAPEAIEALRQRFGPRLSVEMRG